MPICSKTFGENSQGSWNRRFAGRSRLFRLMVIAQAMLMTCLAAGACDRKGSQTGSHAGSKIDQDKLPAGLFLKQEPAGSKDVLVVKREAKAGDAVVVHGRIGGGKSPFVENRAMFTLTDMSLPPCSANPEDKCPTPWDYCCEPADRIASHSLTAQVMGADGKVLRASIESTGGLRPLSEVTVSGRVINTNDDKISVLAIEGIFLRE